MQQNEILKNIDSYWENNIVPTISKYIEIPAKSPAFDPDWERNGYIEQALTLVSDWIDSRRVPGLEKQILKIPGKTPLLILKRKGELQKQLLLYGHLDKQPEMVGWSADLGPWKAVRKGNRLYGRGGADDGYAVFASVCVLEELLKTQKQLPNITIAIEFSEESGSIDLPYYVEQYKSAFGDPDLVVCLDSGAANYDQFWMTTSLRGLVSGSLKVEVLREGVHSGDASGIVPSTFRIARQLIERFEDSKSGKIFDPNFICEIPQQRLDQADRVAKAIGDQVYTKFPFVENVKPVSSSQTELILNRTWRSALEVVGMEGVPELKKAGNVLRPFTTFKLSFRLPPLIEAKSAANKLKSILESDPPYGAKVKFEIEDAATGWNAPESDPKLLEILNNASMKYYNKEALALGEGGSIPFMGMLGKAYPKAQFVITGVLGPESNAHGPNEFLEIDYAKKLTACIVDTITNYSKN